MIIKKKTRSYIVRYSFLREEPSMPPHTTIKPGCPIAMMGGSPYSDAMKTVKTRFPRLRIDCRLCEEGEGQEEKSCLWRFLLTKKQKKSEEKKSKKVLDTILARGPFSFNPARPNALTRIKPVAFSFPGKKIEGRCRYPGSYIIYTPYRCRAYEKEHGEPFLAYDIVPDADIGVSSELILWSGESPARVIETGYVPYAALLSCGFYLLLEVQA